MHVAKEMIWERGVMGGGGRERVRKMIDEGYGRRSRSLLLVVRVA